MDTDILYQLALTQVTHIGPVQARLLIEHCGSAAAVFKAKKKELGMIEGIGEARARSIKAFDGFDEAEQEVAFCKKHHIDIVSITATHYPQRLLHCYDAPTLLFYRGNADLNNPKIVSIVGTRSHTAYGKQVTEQLISDLQSYHPLVVSGLAIGIDAIAHRSAIEHLIPTVGVLAHGLDTIYPSQHKALAKEMLLNGGLLTEHPRKTKPDKHNFPRRNRVVAGISDVTIVVETDTKGGSMITAELACNYNREVFAVPGKTTDVKSSGCLQLIQQNKAALFTNIAQLAEALGWEKKTAKPSAAKPMLTHLTEEEQIITAILQELGTVGIDRLYLQSGLSSSSVAAAILNLEMNHIITSLPGKTYRLAE